MKRNHLLIITLTLALFVSSCKKDEADPEPATPVTQQDPLADALGGSATIPPGADGALYIINHELVYDGDTTPYVSGYAWFDSYSKTSDGGVVTCNGTELIKEFGSSQLPWYTTFFDYLDLNLDDEDIVDWTVEGSSKVPAFTYTDNTDWPRFTYAAPAMVDINQPLTITGSSSVNNDAVFFSVMGYDNKRFTKSMPANSTSVTFTSAELKKVAISGSEIGIQVMPVTMTKQILNGKTYYFVKQHANSQVSVTK